MKLTPKVPTLLSTTQQTTESSSDLQEQIRRRAYELYEQRGRTDGHELEDWLQAEYEIKGMQASAASASPQKRVVGRRGLS